MITKQFLAFSPRKKTSLHYFALHRCNYPISKTFVLNTQKEKSLYNWYVKQSFYSRRTETESIEEETSTHEN